MKKGFLSIAALAVVAVGCGKDTKFSTGLFKGSSKTQTPSEPAPSEQNNPGGLNNPSGDPSQTGANPTSVCQPPSACDTPTGSTGTTGSTTGGTGTGSTTGGTGTGSTTGGTGTGSTTGGTGTGSTTGGTGTGSTTGGTGTGSTTGCGAVVPSCPTPAPTPVVSCADDLKQTFKGYSVKGGTSVQVVSPEVDAVKKYQVVFSKPNVVSYSSGSITASSGITVEQKVTATVSRSAPNTCQAVFDVLVQPDTVFASGTPLERGLKGNLYQLPVGTKGLPDFSKLTSIGKVYVPNFDVPDRDFTLGFPGVSSMNEWFGIDFTGKFHTAAQGHYCFKVGSDDGAIFYLNNNVVVDNDLRIDQAIHYTTSSKVWLNKGSFPIRMKYYQGPRVRIALQLFYSEVSETANCSNVTSWKIVPQSMLTVE
jgi:PA14 domain